MGGTFAFVSARTRYWVRFSRLNAVIADLIIHQKSLCLMSGRPRETILPLKVTDPQQDEKPNSGK